MMNQVFSNGYKLYQRSNSNNWYMRFSIKDQGQLRISLGTSDKSKAQGLAQAQWYKSCAYAEAGLSVTRKSFEIIADEFIKSIELDVQHGDRAAYHVRQDPPKILRYFVGFFGTRQMNAIQTEDIEKYWEWRREYWNTGPGSKEQFIRYDRVIKGRKRSIRRPVKEGAPSKDTLRKEAFLLKRLFEFGKRRGYILEIPHIQIPKSKTLKSRPRPGFTLQEFLHLMKISEARINAYEQPDNYRPDKRLKGPDEIGKNQRIYKDRIKLHCFCMIAGFTGMRPTELFNLSWGDLGTRKTPLDNGDFYEAPVIQARGKGKERELAAMPETLHYFRLLREIYLWTTGRIPNDDDPVFFNYNGVRVRSFKHGMVELLEAAKLRRTRDGRLRDSFSFRHFYITQQIREGVGHHLLSRNTGTSTKMIDAYYSKIRPTEEIKQLIPDWLKSRSFKV